MNYNKVILAGRLTKDPETKNINGKSVCTFFLAVNRPTKEKEADFFLIEVWGKVAELCNQYLKKGSACLVDGSLRQDKWQDKEGKQQSRTKVSAFAVQFLSQDKSSAGNGNSNSGNSNDTFDDNNPPF